VTLERQIIGLTRQEQMTHFGVHEAVRQLAADQRAATDARTDRHVNRGIDALGRTPTRLAQHGAIHICVKTDRHTERTLHRPHDVGVGPPGLGRRRHVAIAGLTAVQLDGPKAANTKCVDLRLCAKEIDTPAKGLTGRGGRKTRLCSQVLRARPHGTDELGSARFDSSVQRHYPTIMPRLGSFSGSKLRKSSYFMQAGGLAETAPGSHQRGHVSGERRRKIGQSRR
jgi:hypothetical protein